MKDGSGNGAGGLKALGLADIRGRDAVFPDVSVKHPRRYDSIVVNSNGVGAITFAARMARDPEFAGRVVVVAKPVVESRRLSDGCTLRARSVDYYAAANGVSREAVLGAIFGADWRQAETDCQRTAIGIASTPDKSVALGPVTSFMDCALAEANRTAHQPLAYGIRNSRLVAALNDLAKDSGVLFAEPTGETVNDLRAHAKGQRPLIVNGTPKPISGAVWQYQPAAPQHFVAAAQMAFTAPKREDKGVIGAQDSFIGMINRDGALDLCVFYPFQDPLSPDAKFYGIFYRAIRKAAVSDKERQQEILLGELEGVAAALGLAPDTPDETMAMAFVPISPWSAQMSRQSGVLDLSRISGGGCPIISGDGMARAGLGGFVAAEALLAGHAPEPAMNRALKRWRQTNYVQYLAMTRAPNLSAFALRHAPGPAMSGFRLQRKWDMWAGAY
tara:strand:- start:15941 stop:17272 length:1332 start_codon:yes stop_codon:yes gene_type:complete